MSDSKKPIFVNARDARPLSSFNVKKPEKEEPAQPVAISNREPGKSPFIRLG